MCVFCWAQSHCPSAPASSSPTVCEFIHRKCRRALRLAGLMRSDVASPASRELSMSGRSARGKQTVDKIFNTALPVHGSNTSEKKTPLQNQKGAIRSPRRTSSEPRGSITIRVPSTETRVRRRCRRPIILVGRLMDFRPSLGTSGKNLALSRGKVQKCSATFPSRCAGRRSGQVVEDAIGWEGAVLGFCLSDWGGVKEAYGGV